MALSQSVVSDLLDAFRAGEGVDLIRDAVRLVLQELIELEATEEIGAGRYERTETRVTDRNGSASAAGDAGRRRRAAHPQAAQRQLLSVHPRASPPHRSGPLRGGDGGVRPRRVDPVGG
jgi:Transposase, Mutator family